VRERGERERTSFKQAERGISTMHLPFVYELTRTGGWHLDLEANANGNGAVFAPPGVERHLFAESGEVELDGLEVKP
jgi:hypothetical protein